MFFTLKIKRPGFKFLLLLLMAGILIYVWCFLKTDKLEVSVRDEPQNVLVIDPGHGGIDGGAIAVSGIKESDINLAIGLRLQKLAEFCGAETLMTRKDDSMRTDMASYSEHNELVYRTELANKYPGACLISIHQNFYPTSQPSGAQVLYALSSGSKELGMLTHNNIISALQPENRRVCAPAAKELYITSHIKCPGILVECGFLSNFSDIEKLCKEDYQLSFAAVLLCSYLQYINAFK